MDDDKKVCSAIGYWYWMFSLRICQSLYDVKPGAVRAVCALLRQLLTAWDGTESLKGSQQMGDGRIFLKNHCASLFLIKAYGMSLISGRQYL
jgi:hypothetical protein